MRSRRWPLCILALIPIAVLGACQRERSGSAPPSVELAAPPVTDIAAIAGQDGPDLVGRPVQIAGASVQEVVSDRVFWIGVSAKQRVLVVVRSDVNIQKGQTVNLTGTVERVPSAPEGLDRLKLGKKAEDLLRIQIVYIQATRVSDASEASRTPGPCRRWRAT